MNSAVPRRWILVQQEASLPSEEDGAGRWSVDHLFLDQDAVPTIVEVKRSSDTRIRREVVGQMLDYAANAVVYWPVERLRAMFEAHHGAAAEQLLGALIGPEPEATPDQFWLKVKTNLQAGKVRLVFVADDIPPELRRVVEFLNQQMDPAEVLAIEVRQYVGEGLRTLVPRVMGQTSVAQQRKTPGATGSGKVWDAESFMKELAARQGPERTAVAQRILDWATARQLSVWWGRGVKDGSFLPMLYLAGNPR